MAEAETTEPTHKDITIEGEVFNLPIQYQAGHELSPIEAKVLSQVWFENVRNNAKKFIKQANDEKDKMDMKAARKAVEEYASEYVFTAVAASSRASLTPEQREARKLATNYVLSKLKETLGLTKKAYLEADPGNAEKFEANVEKVSATAEIIKLAKKRVKEAEALAAGVEAELNLDAAA